MTNSTADQQDSTIQAALSSIYSGGSLSSAAKVISISVNFLLTAILARYLGTSAYGFFSYAQNITNTLTVLGKAGADFAMLRYLPENKEESGSELVTLLLGTGLLLSSAISVLLTLLRSHISFHTLNDPIFVQVLLSFSLLLPVLSTFFIVDSIFRALDRPLYHVILFRLLLPVSQLLGGVIAVLAGFSVVGVSLAFFSASCLSLLVAMIILFLRFPFRPVNPLRTWGISDRIFRYMTSGMASNLGSLLYRKSDIILVGLFFSSPIVAIYSVSAILSNIITLPLTGINQFFPSIAAEYHEKSNYQELEEVYTVCTRWSFSLALLISAIVVVNSAEVLRLFGPEYTDGQLILSLFVVGQLVNSLSGPSDYILLMTDYENLSAMNHWVFGVLNVAISIYLLQTIGFVGAALGTTFTLALVNIARVVELWKFVGIQPLDRNLLKPVVAIIPGILIAQYLPSMGHYAADLILASVIISILFTLTSIVLGITDRDRRLMINLLPSNRDN